MKKLFIFIFIGLSLSGVAQIKEHITGITQRKQPTQLLKTTAVDDTIDIPIFDDFTGDSPFPSESYWLDKKAYINSTHGLNPLSIGIATLDGLDESGFPYDINNNGSDTLADVLTSRYLDLSSDNNVFLSFYYQGGGLGESPGPDDSLVVEFIAPNDTVWTQAWAVKGSNMNTFRPAIVEVADPKFYVKGFQFRFAAYGAKSGAYDIWNIDYVSIAANRNATDTIIEDPAFSQPLPSFVEGYESVPWFHYNNSIYKDTLKSIIRKNGSDPMSISLNQFRLFKDGAQVYANPGFFPASIPYNVDVINPLQISPYTPSNITDEFSLSAEAFLPGTSFGEYLENDTLRGTTTFENYYALDDGSAERAYGILNSFGARIAFRLDPIGTDDLKGLYLRFAHAGVDATKYTFKIGIWENDNGEPGRLIYLSDSNYTPDYGYFHNSLIPYILDTNLPINGSVYVGIRQNTDQPIYLGLDMVDTNSLRNQYRQRLYYGDQFFWYPSLATGNVMIRPFFQYIPREFNIEERNKLNVRVYPNPSSGLIQINSTSELTFKLLDSTGRVVKSGTVNGSLNLEDLQSGMYLLYLENEEHTSHYEKLIIQ